VLVDFLRANAEIFAWSPSDMSGIPRDVAEHSLDIRAGARPVKQHLRRFDKEKRRAIGEEVLISVSHILNSNNFLLSRNNYMHLLICWIEYIEHLCNTFSENPRVIFISYFL
jgi:hypothetical protein